MTTNRLPAPEPSRARHLISRFGIGHVLVVGDVMLDRFLYGRVSRISPEAPVPVVVFDHDEHRLGGAANVAHNIAALGGPVTLVGTIGDDDDGRQLVAELAARGLLGTALVTTPERRTTTKVRVVTSRNQQVARIDYETDGDLGATFEDAVMDVVDQHLDAAKVLLVSDYQKGMVTRRVVAHLVARAHERGIPLLVDPKVPHLDFYRGAALVTPNHLEAESAANRRIRTMEDARDAARAIIARAGVDGVLITLGERGMWLSHEGVDGSLSATAREVSDVTGAGDTVIATLALALAAGAHPAEAAALANEAAGVVVGKFGAATVSADELRQRFPA
ncbi:MAG: D-glycero-beta-D-manno-heptose-7-phosphate kinase [Acidobacteria bacterium]|nr:D-glycero-beta-D-manno-heptose-7-phosphate kinase [Acidobacteriota bacterium]